MEESDLLDLATDRQEQPEVKKTSNYPLVKYTEMPEDNLPDILDIVTGGVERFPNDIVKACRSIKKEMDRSYGPRWNVVVGQSFGSSVSHEKHEILLVYIMGTIGVLLWKNS